ncbi:MAG: PD-(D/E)XK nuclease family protein, partial [Solirubrobacteraceae bacterium]
STAAGARLFAITNALASFLPASAMTELLPRLKLDGDDAHLSPGRARELVDAMGTLGGSAARPEQALRWRDRVTELASRQARPHAADREVALATAARKIAPAVAALVSLAADIHAGAGLGALWASVRTFVETHAIPTRATDEIVHQLDVALRALAADPVTNDVVGIEAMQVIADEVAAVRIRAGRFGEPAVYVGTVIEAAGLPFRSVRILDIAEGMFPRTLREDAVLPSDLRRRLPRHAMSSDEDFATLQLHAFDQVVRGVRERLVVSAPRTDLDGSEREPAALFIEIAAALARPDARTGKLAAAIPNASELERNAFRPARASAWARRSGAPLTPACWLESVAGSGDIPSSWARCLVCDPAAVIERRATMHGFIGPEPLARIVPGLDASFPMSASKLQSLLRCPHRFLLEHVLGFRARPAGADHHRVDSLSYGALLHRVAQRFSELHGTEFGAR